ncbi:hypothetical protein [Comamonas jiangduensis]|uniref:hypothetical protein n=1 Tax=Comamonas jiangduensis TaxID=1194168 RepID=UPI003BF7A973
MPTKKFTESMGDMAKRHRRNGRKKPLRSVSELAQEFGLSPAQLSTYLRSPDSPKPVFKHKSAFGRGNTWYDPKEVRDWMKARGGK